MPSMSSNCTSAIELPGSSSAADRCGRPLGRGDTTGLGEAATRQGQGVRGADGRRRRAPEGDARHQPPAHPVRPPAARRSGLGIRRHLVGPGGIRVVVTGEDPTHRAGHPPGPPLGQVGHRPDQPLVQRGGEQLQPPLVVGVGEGHEAVHPLVGAQRPAVVAAAADQLPGPELRHPGDVGGPVDLGGGEHRPEHVVDRGPPIEVPHELLDVVLVGEVGGRGRRLGHRPQGRTGLDEPDVGPERRGRYHRCVRLDPADGTR